MKVGVWINNEISPKHGGGFSYTSKLIDLLDSFAFEDVELCFVSFDFIEKSYQKEVIVLDQTAPRVSLFDKLKIKLVKKLRGGSSISYKDKQNSLFNTFLRKQLVNKKVDVLYYLAQMEKHIPHFPFIATNWDLGHLSMAPFPETTANGELEKRTHWYKKELPKALSVFVESKAGKQELVSLLGYNSQNIMEVPIFPGAIVSLDVTERLQQKILTDFKIKKGNYFIYPAQFWEHKNHKNLMYSFSEFSKEHPEVYLILSGSDKGMLSEILELANELGLTKRVRYLGFISNEELYTLYKNAIALVMPTFLGPTNMPLLEARMIGCPVICSDFNGHREQLGDGALYFNPNDKNAITRCIFDIFDGTIREEIIRKTNKELHTSKYNEQFAVNAVASNFKRLKELYF